MICTHNNRTMDWTNHHRNEQDKIQCRYIHSNFTITAISQLLEIIPKQAERLKSRERRPEVDRLDG